MQRGGYEARLAERSYRAVDPENRLVARTLEQRWEEALRREQDLREGYDRFRRESPRRLTPEELDRIRALDADIPSLWHAAETPAADRQEIIRALVERATVSVAGDSESVLVRIRRIWRPTNGGSATWRTSSAWDRADSRNGSGGAMSMPDASGAGSIA